VITSLFFGLREYFIIMSLLAMNTNELGKPLTVSVSSVYTKRVLQKCVLKSGIIILDMLV
jgi:hypothetical protein